MTPNLSTKLHTDPKHWKTHLTPYLSKVGLDHSGSQPFNYTEEMVKLNLINLPVLDFLEPVPELYGVEDAFVPESNYRVRTTP